MKIEYLYPEIANLCGDSGNFRYLQQCLPQAETVMTHLGDKPAFLTDCDLTYCGTMPESGQQYAIEALKPYTDQIKAAIGAGRRLLFTGNAMEIFGQSIVCGSQTVAGLGLYDIRAVSHPDSRCNGFFLGTAGGCVLTAFTSRSSDITTSMAPFATVQRGYGRSGLGGLEGVVDHNFMGTSLIGPLLVLNPAFTGWLLQQMGSAAKPAFLEQSEKAYQLRLAEMQNPKAIIDE